MAAVLHLLKGERSRAGPHGHRASSRRPARVTVVLLAGARPPVAAGRRRGAARREQLAYDALLELIFEADQVITW